MVSELLLNDPERALSSSFLNADTAVLGIPFHLVEEGVPKESGSCSSDNLVYAFIDYMRVQIQSLFCPWWLDGQRNRCRMHAHIMRQIFFFGLQYKTKNLPLPDSISFPFLDDWAPEVSLFSVPMFSLAHVLLIAALSIRLDMVTSGHPLCLFLIAPSSSLLWFPFVWFKQGFYSF